MKKLFLFFLAAQNTLIGEGNMFCEKSKVAGFDFICGEEASRPYQPCKDFELVYGEATTATTLWVLSELHNREKTTVECVKLLSENQENHILYYEGAESGKNIPCDRYTGLSKKPGRICKGWDDMDAYKKMQTYIPDMPEIDQNQKMRNQLADFKKSYERDKAAGQSDREYDAKLKQIKAGIGDKNQVNIFKMKYSDQAIDIMLKTINWALELRKNGKSYKEVFATPVQIYRSEGYKVKQKDLYKLKEVEEKRNQALLKTIQKHPTGTMGIFIAGKEHGEALKDKVDGNSCAILKMS